MSNPFKWYVYISIDGGPWQRKEECPNSEKGRQLAERLASHLGCLVGIETKVIQERKEVE